MVKDEDDQDPSFNYQGCTVQDGACINPEYHTTVSICNNNYNKKNLKKNHCNNMYNSCTRNIM